MGTFKKCPRMRHPGKGFKLQGKFHINGIFIRVYENTQPPDRYLTGELEFLLYWHKPDFGWIRTGDSFETLSGVCYVALSLFGPA